MNNPETHDRDPSRQGRDDSNDSAGRFKGFVLVGLFACFVFKAFLDLRNDGERVKFANRPQFNDPGVQAFVDSLTELEVDVHDPDVRAKLLETGPQTADLITYYIAAAHLENRSDDAWARLSEFARRRPIDLEWHRTYQNFTYEPENRRRVLKEYDDMADADPGNADLQYLRGLIETNNQRAIEFQNTALLLDPRHADAWEELSMELSGRGSWHEAVAAAKRALEFKGGDLDLWKFLGLCQLAAGDLAGVEESLGRVVAAQPYNFDAIAHLAAVYFETGEPNKVETLLKNHYRYAREEQGSNPQFSGYAERHNIELSRNVSYIIGDFPRVVKLFDQPGQNADYTLKFFALMELRQYDEAAAFSEGNSDFRCTGFDYLAVSLDWAQARRPDKAKSWETKAITSLEELGYYEEKLAASWLRGDSACRVESARGMRLRDSEKAILFAALWLKSERKDEELRVAARNFNVERYHPYRLINRIIAEP